MKNKFFNIKNSTNDSVDVYIYGDIVPDTDWKWDDTDTMPKDIQTVLNDHEGKRINLFVNSGGGSVFAGLAILNMLKRARDKGSYIVATIDGLAGSIASVLIFGADEVHMPSNAYLMVHRAWSFGQGNAGDFKKLAEDLEKIDEGILITYEQNLKEGVDIAHIQELVNNETWLTGKESAELFNITLTDSVEAVACTSDYFKNYKFVPTNLVTTPETPAQPEPQPTPEPIQNQTPNEDEKDQLLMEIELL